MSNWETHKGKATKKKRKMMIKVDPSLLGLTVHTALDGTVGQMDTLDTAANMR